MNDLIVEAADPTEAAEVASVAALTFPLACPPGFPPADIESFIAAHLGQADFEGHIADPDSDVLLARALPGGPVLGYALLHHREPTDPGVAALIASRPVAEISKMYVLPDHHAHRNTSGRSAARTLMEAALAAARRRGAAVAWLGVNQENARARRFYEKMGFVESGTRTFDVNGSVGHDFVLTHDLST